MQLFVSNSYIVGTISYLTLPLAGIMFILFMKEAVLEAYSGLLTAFALLMGAYLSISILLQLFMGVDYIEIWFVFILMIMVVVMIIMGLLIYESFKGTPSAAKYIAFISVLVLTTVAETLMFLTGHFMEVSSLSNIGIAIFLLFLIMDTLLHMNKLVQKEGESKYLLEIAYKDALTGSLNRAAFEKDIDHLLSNEKKQAFRLTIFDLNNLKKINDQHGHETGDQALKDFYTGLTIAYAADANCYRIGGDEFMVIQRNITTDCHQYSVKNLLDYMAVQESLKGYDFRTAYGSDVYRYDMNFGEFKHRVDRLMYEQKFRTKEKSGTIDVALIAGHGI